MKLNLIEIVQLKTVMVKNGEAVEFGQPLFEIS